MASRLLGAAFPSLSRRPLPVLRNAAPRTYVRNQGFYRNSGYYQRFQSGSNFLKRWASRPTFYYEVGGFGLLVGGFYVGNLEAVPVSGRRRFNIISPESEASMSDQLYRSVLQQYGRQILPEWDSRTRMVKRVMDRLIPNSGIEGVDWKVHVIDSPEKNAFVIPGGKVFVFSGILPICETEDGLAAVLGHEIAHNLAHHLAERMSQYWMITPFVFVLEVSFGVPFFFSRILLDLAFSKPGGRRQESEADYIGLLMMAQSCFDPNAAVGLWERMHKAEQFAPPEFISTHPSSYNRRDKISEWLPEANEKRMEAGCAISSQYADQFRKTFRARDNLFS